MWASGAALREALLLLLLQDDALSGAGGLVDVLYSLLFSRGLRRVARELRQSHETSLVAGDTDGVGKCLVPAPAASHAAPPASPPPRFAGDALAPDGQRRP